MRLGFDAKRIFHNTTGLGNYSRDLISVLNKFYPNDEYRLYNPKPKKIDSFQLTAQTTEILPKQKIWQKFSSIWRQGPIVKQLKEEKIDIYHGLTGEIPRRLSKSGIKSVVTIHDLIFVRYPKLYPFFDRKIHFKKFLYAAENADKIIAISEQTKRDIVEFLKIDEAKIEVIYQGCNAVFKEKQTEKFKREILNKHNLPDEFILNVGTVEERKNIISVIKAIKNINVPLVVVGGKTSYFREVIKCVEQNNLENRVYFLEELSVQELSALYQIATIFVYPSIFEGFGIPIIEAIYSKTPVITSKGSCFSEAGGLNSIYINSKDVEDLEYNIQFLLNNPNKREEIVSKGYEFVQKFNDENIAKSYMNLYKKLHLMVESTY